jgi:tRNA (adenine57-N1/adenine58-N1)-methyltransferase
VNQVFSVGERVVLFDKAGRRVFVTLQSGGKVHLHTGVISHDDLIGVAEGTIVSSSEGARYLALRPTLVDQAEAAKRRFQPVYPKDLGAIAIYLDLKPGASVLEVGLGTGGVTDVILRSISPGGSYTGCDIREDVVKDINDRYAQLARMWSIEFKAVVADAYAVLPDGKFNRVVLDVPEPWRTLDKIKQQVESGGVVVAILPNVLQVKRLVSQVSETKGFSLNYVFELTQRFWNMLGKSSRPFHRMVGHTSFLVQLRRLAADDEFEVQERIRV